MQSNKIIVMIEGASAERQTAKTGTRYIGRRLEHQVRPSGYGRGRPK